LFVFDVGETESTPGSPPLPRRVEQPLEVPHGTIGSELERTIANAGRDGVRISEREHGAQRAGSIQIASPGAQLEVLLATKSRTRTPHSVPLRYELLLNSNLSAAARYATLVHELGHLYCGHLGTPEPRWWSDRRSVPLAVREFEAESICQWYARGSASKSHRAEYLVGYVRKYTRRRRSVCTA
jgi:IrrE N-terminal-like domain